MVSDNAEKLRRQQVLSHNAAYVLRPPGLTMPPGLTVSAGVMMPPGLTMPTTLAATFFAPVESVITSSHGQLEFFSVNVRVLYQLI